MSARLISGTPGVPAPPLELPAAGGERRSLAEFRGRPVIVSFLGPANCAFCRAHLIKMIQAKDDLAKADAGVILVAFSDPELLMSKMMRDLDLPFLLLLDRARESYARWGLGSFTWKMLLRPGLHWAIVKSVLQRRLPMGWAPHYNQLGGDFVVDRAGKLIFVKRMRNLHDRAHVEDILAALSPATAI